VRIGGGACKPSREVLPMDQIAVRIDQFDYLLKVVAIPPGRVGAKWVGLYREDLTSPEELKEHQLLRSSREYYREKGTGRPTKKDRRDLETYLDEPE
jgi:ribosome-associated heat shock protein Hsp15